MGDMNRKPVLEARTRGSLGAEFRRRHAETAGLETRTQRDERFDLEREDREAKKRTDLRRTKTPQELEPAKIVPTPQPVRIVPKSNPPIKRTSAHVKVMQQGAEL